LLFATIPKSGEIMNKLSTVMVICLTSAELIAADKYQIAVARMSDRTIADMSFKPTFFTAKRDGYIVNFDFSTGIGAVKWDHDPNYEGRVHLDGTMGINSWYFTVGSFVTYGRNRGAALGIRTGLGRQSHHGLFIGGYWEFTAPLPGAERNSRAGLGVQAGYRF
jgi:hypothetical protein